LEIGSVRAHALIGVSHGNCAATRIRALWPRLSKPFGHHAADVMPRLSRRSFLAASAALMASPVFAAKPPGEDADVIVIGAGAAGIAAARRLAAEKIRVLVFEGSDRIGGRCATDTTTFGAPFDLGAHWIHNPDGNPLLAGGAPAGLDV
jgi:hypothetical protein